MSAAMSYFSSHGRQLPPGPMGSLLFGNAFQMPRVKSWLTYTEWGKKYGDVIYLNVLGKQIIVLNSRKASVELLEKRTSIYSSRPTMAMAELLGCDGVTLTPDNERFDRFREILHKGLNVDITKGYRSSLESEVKKFLRRLHATPTAFGSHIHMLAVSNIMNVIYGYEVERDDDPILKIVEEGGKVLGNVTRRGPWLVDFIPALRYLPSWFPGAGFKRLAERLKPRVLAMNHVPFDWTKRKFEEGSSKPSFVANLLEAREDEYLIMWAAGSLFSGGWETADAIIRSFILAMALYPKVQNKAQAEIDEVVGRERLPGFSDISSLPYVDALIKELLRWNTVGPTGVPHGSIRDDLYEGLFIPKNSIVFPNVWGIFNDENAYKNPTEFNPDRFLPEGESAVPELDPRKTAFGFGRRICPGFHVAEDELYLAVVQSLATFTIRKPLDKDGREVEPRVEYTSGSISRPEDFECRIEPRFGNVTRLLET